MKLHGIALLLASTLALAGEVEDGMRHLANKEYKPATEAFQRASALGSALADRNIAFIYYNGLGLPQDVAKAVEWFTKAAERGHRRSQFRIGEILFVGDGAPKDRVEADKWWRIALSKDGESSAWMRSIVDAGERKMTPEQLAEAQRRAEKWKPAPDAR